MGTFHDNLGSLHGITVIIETKDRCLYVGRCHDNNDEHVHLLKFDVFDPDNAEDTRENWIKKAQEWGVFAHYKSLKISNEDIVFCTPLGKY